MADKHVLVFDLGTSGPRCILFDESAKAVEQRAAQWCYVAEADASYMARSFDMEVSWHSICRLVKNILGSARLSPGDITALAVTGQRQSVVFLDDGGDVIYAGPNTDLRAVFEGGAIDDEMRDRVYQVTGRIPSFLFSAAKLRWFRLQRPEAYGRIASVVTLADWLVWRLTGTLASEQALAAEAGLLDIRRREWPTALLNDLGVVSRAAPLMKAGELAGRLRGSAAAEIGLPSETLVAVASADTQCGLLGMGVTQERQVGVVTGWSTAVHMVTLEPKWSPEATTWAGCHLMRDRWVLESSPGDLGNSYRWLADTLLGGSASEFERMDEMAAAVPVGSEGTLAFLGPSRMDMARVGMTYGGLLFPVPLTYSDIGRGHMVRASLEAAAYVIRANVEQIEELASVRAGSITVGGGMTRTTTWTRMLTDVLGRSIGVSPTPQTSSLGAYLCARTALGDYGSLAEASQSVRPHIRTIDPDARNAAEYEDYYSRWLEMSGMLEGLDL